MTCLSGFKFNRLECSIVDQRYVLAPKPIDATWKEEDVNYSDNIKTFTSGATTRGAIKADGTLWTWGFPRGLGNECLTSITSSPVQTVSGGNNWKTIHFGRYHSTAIKTDGTLWLWGDGGSGRLGDNSTIGRSSPVQTVSSGTNWKQASGGETHTAAIKTDGTLWLWGAGGNGRLGNNSTISQFSPVQTVSGGTDWKSTSAGFFHTAAIKTDGTLWTWGYNGQGQLGDDSVTSRSSPVQTVSGGADWKQISLGCRQTAAIKTDGTLWLWGRGNYGALGNDSVTNRSSPVQTVSGGTNWKQVSADKYGSAAVKTDGTLWLWGCGVFGRLGVNSASTSRSSPVQTISGGTDWKQVETSEFNSFALKSNCILYAWGRNVSGAAGLPTTLDYGLVPRAVDFDDVFVRKEEFSEGGLWIWGAGTSGMLGTNNTILTSSPVQTVSGGTNWKQLQVNSTHSAAIKTDGTLWLWGCNHWGVLGINSIVNQSSPVQTISGGTNWKQISAGGCHSAAIKTDGTLWTWGNAANGRLGHNSIADRSSPIQTISGGTNWKQVSSGISFTAAIKTDGTLWLWGSGCYGRLGNHDGITEISSPIQTISGGTNWKQVTLGGNVTAAIKTDGTLWLWGRNDNGQLGINSIVNQSSPIQTISGGTNWKQVSLGQAHSAAIKTDGTLWIWGNSGSHRLGNGNNTIDMSSPVQTISGGTNWKQVSLGVVNHSAAIKTDGTLWMWGAAGEGRLGMNDTIQRSSPTQTISGGNNWKQVSLGSTHSAGIREDCW